MKVYGKLVGHSLVECYSVGSYAAFETDYVMAKTARNGKGDNEFFLEIRTMFFEVTITKKDGSYLNAKMADFLVKEMATKTVLDLDAYDMGFNIILNSGVPTLNRYNLNGDAIPLEVKIVKTSG